jgi:hypothetical protein
MQQTLRGFCIAAAIPLAINLVMLALLGNDADLNRFWILLNLPGLPCGFASVLLVPAESTALAVTSLASCIIWGAVGATIAKLTTKRQ